jgi:hypothetical protein
MLHIVLLLVFDMLQIAVFRGTPGGNFLKASSLSLGASLLPASIAKFPPDPLQEL